MEAKEEDKEKLNIFILDKLQKGVVMVKSSYLSIIQSWTIVNIVIGKNYMIKQKKWEKIIY